MKTFEFENIAGEEIEIKFVKAEYMDGNLAIAVHSFEPDEDCWDMYGMLTVNLGHSMYEGEAYLDTNNCGHLCQWFMQQDWAEFVGAGQSGYCTYPLVAFTYEFLDEICGSEV